MEQRVGRGEAEVADAAKEPAAGTKRRARTDATHLSPSQHVCVCVCACGVTRFIVRRGFRFEVVIAEEVLLRCETVHQLCLCQCTVKARVSGSAVGEVGDGEQKPWAVERG